MNYVNSDHGFLKRCTAVEVTQSSILSVTVDTTSEGSHPDPLFVAVRDAANEGCTVERTLSVAEAEGYVEFRFS